jgi:large subunit ribosomal protein L9e
MVKSLLNSIDVKVPKGLTVQVGRRQVTIKGPLGTLKRDFTVCSCLLQLMVLLTPFVVQHATLSLKLLANTKGGRVIRVELWNGDRKEIATIKSVSTEIKNLITGVQYGFKFEMKFVYAHFPINCNITPQKNQIEVSVREIMACMVRC